MHLEDMVRIARLRADVQARRVRPVRQNAGLSQREVAAAIQVSPSTIAQWERAARLPHGEAALRYAALLQQLRRIKRPDGAARAA
jgi:transcriptional regulator with XRE-family HTH domain